MKLDKNTTILLVVGGALLLYFLTKKSGPAVPTLPAARPSAANPLASLLSSGLSFLATSVAGPTPGGAANPNLTSSGD